MQYSRIFICICACICICTSEGIAAVIYTHIYLSYLSTKAIGESIIAYKHANAHTHTLTNTTDKDKHTHEIYMLPVDYAIGESIIAEFNEVVTVQQKVVIRIKLSVCVCACVYA